MSLQISGRSNWEFEGSSDSSKPPATEKSKYPLSLRAKALTNAIGNVGVGRLSLGIAKVAGGVILRNTAKLLPSGQTKNTLHRQSKQLKHSGIRIGAKTISVYMSTLLKSGNWTVTVPLINIAKHQQVCSQPWAKPADTEAAEALIDGILDSHLIREEDRVNPLVRQGLARAQVREAMKNFGVADEEIHRALREPTSQLKEWDEAVNDLRATRDGVLKAHGVNDPRTSEIPAVQEAQKKFEMATNVQFCLQKLAGEKSVAIEEGQSPLIRLTETPKGQDIQRSGNLHYRYVDSSKLTAMRDGICFGSCIRWATQYNALAPDAKGNGKGLDALEKILSEKDQDGMDVEATANQLTSESLQYFPQVDFFNSNVGRQSPVDIAEAVAEIAVQAGWVQDNDVSAFKLDIRTVLALYNYGKRPKDIGSLYEAIAGKEDSPFRETDYWKNGGAVAEKNAAHFIKALKESLSATHVENSPLLQDETRMSAVIELSLALQSGQRGPAAIQTLTNTLRRSELDLARKDLADQKVSGFIANQRGYSYQPQTEVFGALAQVKTDNHFLSTLKENFHKLEDGFYHFDIDCGQNESHSMALVKEGDEVMLIDPNLGAIRAKGPGDAVRLIGDVLKMYTPIPKSKYPGGNINEPFHAPRLAFTKPLVATG